MSYLEDSYNTWVKWLKSSSAFEEIKYPWPFKYSGSEYASLRKMDVIEKGNMEVHIVLTVSFNMSVHAKTGETLMDTKSKVEWFLKSNVNNRLKRGSFKLTFEIRYY